MNEADTSNDRAVMESPNSANSLQLEQDSCPFYSVVPVDNMAMMKLPLLKPAVEIKEELQTVTLPEDANQQDWVAEPDSEQQLLINAEFQKLLLLNEELRNDNNSLYEQVEQLKDELAESEKALQWQKRRSSVTESIINQQAQELAAAQEQIQSLYQQLETANQTTQRQEDIIETYKAQLQISQQRLAQLERECALLQTNYNEQSQQLSQSETACRELRSRLMRQQRQTLQFKAALEKCLESPAPGYDSSDDTANHTQNPPTPQTRFSRKARSLFPNAQPIRPWSGEPESPNHHLNYPWAETSASTPSHNSQSVPQPSSPWNWSEKQDTPPQPAAASEVDEPPTTAETASPQESSQLDEQLDSLIQMFFTAPPASTTPPPPVTESNVSSNQSDVSVWDNLDNKTEDEERLDNSPKQQAEVFEAQSNTATTAANYLADEATISPVNHSSVSFDVSHAQVFAEEPENYWLDPIPSQQAQTSAPELSEASAEDFVDENQSPSPVVYPQRPPKRRKSLASVELPNFRPYSQ